MLKKKAIIALVLLAGALGSTAASAKWVSVAKVTRVRHYTKTGTYEMTVWFDRDVASGCTENRRIRLKTSDADVIDAISRTAVAAKLSGRNVEVNTDGCEGNYGKLDYLSLK